MLRPIGDALRSPWSLAIALVAALGVFLLSVWLPNLGVVWRVVTSGSSSVGDKVAFLWDSLTAIRTNFTALGAWLTGATAILFGLDVAVAARYVHQRLEESSSLSSASVVPPAARSFCRLCSVQEPPLPSSRASRWAARSSASSA